MAQFLRKRVYHINSLYASDISYPNGSSFSYPIDFSGSPSVNEPDVPFTHACIIKATIPRSYYNIRSGFNTFQLLEGASNAYVSIAPGVYNVYSWMDALSAAITLASPNGYTYTVTKPDPSQVSDTGKLTFTVTGNSGVQPSFVIYAKSPFAQLGFNANFLYGLVNNTVTFAANKLVSEDAINLSPIGALYIHSDICSSGVSGGDNILCVVPTPDSPFFGNIEYASIDTETNSRALSTPSAAKVFSFTITDVYNQPVDLNGQQVTYELLVYAQQDAFKDVGEYIHQKALEALIAQPDGAPDSVEHLPGTTMTPARQLTIG